MNFKTYGNITNEKILLLAPVLPKDQELTNILKPLNDYYLIIPDLAKRDEDFISFQRDVDSIYKYCRDENIKNFKYICSFSYCSNIAIYMLERNLVKVEKAVLEGVINININFIFKKILKMKFSNYRKKIEKDEHTIEKINNLYPNMYKEIKKLAENINDKSLDNFLSEVSNFKFSKIKNTSLLFIYGKKDPSLKNIEKLKKKYLQADFLSLEGIEHGNIIFKDSKTYFNLLKS